MIDEIGATGRTERTGAIATTGGTGVAETTGGTATNHRDGGITERTIASRIEVSAIGPRFGAAGGAVRIETRAGANGAGNDRRVSHRYGT